MKTFPTHNHDIHSSISKRKLLNISKYDYEYDHIDGDRNKNATANELECQRDACEEELYRLRYGLEQLLANTNYREQQSNRNLQTYNNFKSTGNRPNDFNGLSDRNYDPNSRQTSDYSPKPQHLSESYISTLPSRQNVRAPINSFHHPTTSNNLNLTDIFASADLNDPLLKTLILKILEAKALDCICTGYSKQNTQRQISDALLELNHKLKPTNSSRSITTVPSPVSSRSRISSKSRHNSKKKPHSSRKDSLAVPRAKTRKSKKSKKRGCFGC